MSSAIAFYGSFLKTIPDLTEWKDRSREVLERRKMGDVGGKVMELERGRPLCHVRRVPRGRCST